jgi:hypothetical protein
MNLIRVGIEQFTSADEKEIDAAVQFTRDTYASVSLGVGRIQRRNQETSVKQTTGGMDSDFQAGKASFLGRIACKWLR